MEKPLQYAVAIILKKSEATEEFLMVQRPSKDPHLSDVWGLPAVVMKPGELPEQAAMRVCREKLNCSGEVLRFNGAMYQLREEFDLCLLDIEVLLNPHTIPDVTKATTHDTRYVAQKWTNNTLDLLPAAQKGSCCSMLYLTDKGLLKRKDWIVRL